ncbi:hypothetical protein PR003_g28734 [Phytophthora rubi]|uniref:BED-type domain-containing protein n=1 Tax=Phytophthora rubi TaxID=129364 RepID=A0A6A4BTC9_9STRA|nr:hypothetical protein PR001_g27791 [Phytophthora rubi]KAE9277644.1 hypothetical protein PR003_g28734 [Phytophthora rubi]
MAPSPAQGGSSQRSLQRQTPPLSCVRRRLTPRSLTRSPNVRYSPYPQQTCQRRRVSDSPASSDQATVEGRFEDGQSQQGSFPRATAEEEDHPPAVAKPGRKHGHIWRHFKKIDPKKTHGRVQCLGCRQYLGSSKPQRNMVPHVLQCDNISLLDTHFVRRVYNVPEGATTVSPSQPVAPGAAPTVPAQASVPQASANFQTASPVTQEQFDMMLAPVTP